MHAVILAAGEGSRMGEHTDDVPKAFMEVDGRTLYERQREALAPHADSVTVVLGYRHEAVEERVDRGRTVVVDRWDEFDNAGSLHRALRDIAADGDGDARANAGGTGTGAEADPGGTAPPLDADDHVLVLNGDVVVSRSAVDRVVRCHAATPDHSVVGHLPGVQSDHTAVRLDADGRVVDYGRITGYRHAGLGVIDREHVPAAVAHLDDRRTEWYPSVYEAVPTLGVVVPPAQHLEINRPRDKRSAEGRLPLP